MSPRAAALAGLLLASAAARADSWDPGDVAEAERLRAAEAARAADYRERVASGEVRSDRAPMPREAPQRPGDGSAGEALRGAADVVDAIERWLRGESDAPARTPSPPRREELRRRERERRSDGPSPWWQEEERRTRGGR